MYGSLLFLGWYARGHFEETQRIKLENAEIAKAQSRMLEYEKQTEELRNTSDGLIEQSGKDEDGPVAPVIRNYFDRLREHSR